jgi:hypothetical protein
MSLFTVLSIPQPLFAAHVADVRAEVSEGESAHMTENTTVVGRLLPGLGTQFVHQSLRPSMYFSNATLRT